MTYQDPLVLRRRLRVALRNARNESGLTQKDVAATLGWSPSKLIRIENGSVSVTIPDLKALLEEYGVKDRTRIDELVDLSRHAREPGWLTYSDVLSKDFTTYLSYEASAARTYQYQPSLLPGLLQTEEYARATLRDVYATPDGVIDRLWAVRQRRQELHDRELPPEMVFVLDEPVIRRQLGGAAVMVRQLKRLREDAARPHVTLQIIPFSAGGHTGLTGPIVVLQFADPSADDIVFLEGARNDLAFVDAPDEASRYLNDFYILQDKALDPAGSLRLLDEAIDEMAGGGAGHPNKPPGD
jgi:transcriptional regulator with XRE-family HTH domain